jgi:hypothetical protein
MSLSKTLNEQNKDNDRTLERLAANQKEILDDLKRLAIIGTADLSDIELLRQKQSKLTADIDILRKWEAENQ